MTASQLTVLFDLDDTLLSNDMEVFFPFYLKALSKHMDVAPFEQLASILMAGTKQMMSKTLPARTLEETFDETFYPGLGISKETIRDRVDQFYRVGFNQLEPHTGLRPEARPVMEHCFSKGYETIIATNPLMPLEANLNRLRWANVSAEDFPYTLITSYETSHFCKPHPAYFAEILGRLGWKQNPVVMIGNSLDDDILPALQLGIPTFWLVYNNHEIPASPVPGQCTTGRLQHIPAWLDNIAANQFSPTPFTPQGLLAVMQSTPAVFSSLIKVIPSSENELLSSLQGLTETEIQCNVPEVYAATRTVAPEEIAKNIKMNGSIFKTLEQFVTLRTGLLEKILPHRKNWSGSESKSEMELFTAMQKIAQSDQETIRRLYSLLGS